ncbi:hypothetical protein ACHAXT_007389 [Thalassiosira profunda]
MGDSELFHTGKMNLLARTRNASRRSGRYTAPVLIKRSFSFRKRRGGGGSSNNDDESSLDSGFTRQLEADIFQMATTDRQRGDKQRGRANDESLSVATASLGEFTDATEDIIQEHSPGGCGWDIRAVNLYITRAIFPVSGYRDEVSSVLDNSTLESVDDSYTCGTGGCNPFEGGSEMHEV